MRKCGKCGGTGHNARTCKNNKTKDTEKPKTYGEIGRKILAQNKQKTEKIEINGIKPQRGLWLVNKARKRVAGKIQLVRRKGVIVWKDFAGVFVNSEQQIIIDSGYSYFFVMPKGNGWKYLNCGTWTDNCVMRKTDDEAEDLIEGDAVDDE